MRPALVLALTLAACGGVDLTYRADDAGADAPEAAAALERTPEAGPPDGHGRGHEGGKGPSTHHDAGPPSDGGADAISDGEVADSGDAAADAADEGPRFLYCWQIFDAGLPDGCEELHYCQEGTRPSWNPCTPIGNGLWCCIAEDAAF